MTTTDPVLEEWEGVLARLNEAITLRWFSTDSRMDGLIGWYTEFTSDQADAYQFPTSQERTTQGLDPYLVSRTLSALPPRAAYRQLRSITPRGNKPSPDLAYTQDTAASLVALFGHTLIEAARDSLPIDVRMDAIDFRATDDFQERMVIMQRTMLAMRNTVWDERHPLLSNLHNKSRKESDGEHVSYTYHPWAVLPHVFGRFPESPMMPNCMGMSIMMSAWCRLAGVPYMHCRLIQHGAIYRRTHFLPMLQQILAYCDAHNIVLSQSLRRHITRNIEIFQESNLDTFSGSLSEGHGFVCAEIYPDHWLALDPWMENCYWLDGSMDDCGGLVGSATRSPSSIFRTLLQQTSVVSGLTIVGTEQGNDESWRQARERVETSLLEARHIQESIDRYVPEYPHDFSELLTAACVPFIAVKHLTADILPADLAREGSEIAEWILGRLRSRYGAVHRLADTKLNKLFAHMVRDYPNDAELARRVREDIVALGIIGALEWPTNAVVTPETDKRTLGSDPYVSIEYGLAPMNVGLGALVHLLAWDDEIKSILRPTDILRLSTSQLVWWETVTAAHYRYAENVWDNTTFTVRIREDSDEEVQPPRRPSFGELVMTDGQEWESLLASSGIKWLTASELEIIRSSTRSMMEIPPFQQHLQVRRLLARLQSEYEQSQQPNTPNNQEADDAQEEGSQGSRQADRSVA